MTDDKPSSTQNKVLDVSTIQPEDYEKILRMRREIEGKTIVIEGGGYTAEAWELEGKLQVLKQLRLARRFRATMEAAYEDAKQSNDKKKAFEILARHKNTILEMASLTDAVRGGYTLDSYDEYKLDHQRHNYRMCHLNAQHAFSNLRKKMARERYSDDRSRSSNNKRNRDKQSISNEEKSKSKYMESATTGLPKTSRKKRKMEDKTETSAHSVSISQDDVTATKKKRTSLQKSTKQSTRKCHYCKKVRSDFIPCTYWHINGKQCKKSFCLACIAANPIFNKISEGGKEFHCPSCVGTCDCETCLRFQEQERLNARSSKRSLQGNNSF